MKNLNKISKPSMVIISSIMAMTITTMSVTGGNTLNTSYAAEDKATMAIGTEIKCKGSSNVNIRSTCETKPKKGNNIVGTLTPGTTAKITGKTPCWYKIKYGNKTGYVRWDTVVKANKASGERYVSMKFTTTQNLNMRSKASTTNSSVILTIPKGKELTATKHFRDSKNQNWYSVSYNGRIGWVTGAYLKENKNFKTKQDKTGSECLVRLQITAKSGLNVRSQANSNSNKLGKIPYNEVVTANRESKGWYWVGGYNGWISGEFTKAINNARSSVNAEDMKVALIRVDSDNNNSGEEGNALNLISSKESSNEASKTYTVYKISPAVNIGVNIEKVTVKVPEVETAIIDKLESGEIVGLNLSQERNDFRINSSSSLSSEDINKIVESLDYYVVNNTSAKVYKSVNELEDGTIDYKEMDYKLNDNEIVIVLEVDPSKDYVKVVLENGEIAYLETKALV